MPISKKGSLYFTDEQYARARARGALEYAQEQGYDLVRDGNTYYLREHDSMIFTQDGRWFWNAQKLAGRALEFIQHYEGRTLPEAVTILADGGTPSPCPLPSHSAVPDTQKPFVLPPKAGSYKRLFAYLCGARGLDADIVRDLIQDGRLYESAQPYTDPGTGELRELHNAVFLGLDGEGTPRGGFQRGLSNLSAKPFKRDVAGSEKQFAFCVPGHLNTRTVAVFEASIDAVSHATLSKINGEDYRTIDRIALGGVWESPLLHYLGAHPQMSRVRLCLDNDPAGVQGTAHLRKALEGTGVTITEEYPPQGKDWNEYLCLYRQIQAECARPPTERQEEGCELEP